MLAELLVMQMLTVYYIQVAFANGFHLLPDGFQKASFWRAKGYLLEGKRLCFAC